MLVPVMSAGIRSGVNWMRLKSRSSASPIVRTSIVLPRPGTPSSRTWPPAMRLMRTSRTISACPTITLPTSSSIRSTMERNSETGIGGGGATVSATVTVVILGLGGEKRAFLALGADDDDERDHHHDHDESERHRGDRRNF